MNKSHEGQIQTAGGRWIEDLTGQRFGKLVVLGLSDRRDNKRTYWDCRCDCGSLKTTRSSYLKNGECQSCSCYRKEQLQKKTLKDLTGKRFGKWVVLFRSGTDPKCGSAIWRCRCDCGTVKDVRGTSLTSGHSHDCGCDRSYPGRSVLDLEGQKFGELIVVKRTGYSKNKQILWECKCSCGQKVVVRGSNLRNGKTKSCGCLVSSGEKLIGQILQESHIVFKTQKTFESLVSKNNSKLRFDFYLPNYNCCIEYDGEQHFKPIEYFGGQKAFEKRQYHDAIKNKFCENNGIKLIRIPYTDFDKIDKQYILDRIGDNGK